MFQFPTAPTSDRRRTPAAGGLRRAVRVRGYTLLELLIVVAVLGIAGAMVIPAMAQTGVLRIQAAVRTLVSDITFMQADAMAFQSRRVLVFGRVARFDGATQTWQTAAGQGYTIYAPPPGAATLDLQNDVMIDPSDARGVRPLSRDFTDERYGGATVTNAAFNGGAQLIFDELGGPVRALTGDDPGTSGSVEVDGPNARFLVAVEAYTGRVTVTRTQ